MRSIFLNKLHLADKVFQKDKRFNKTCLYIQRCLVVWVFTQDGAFLRKAGQAVNIAMEMNKGSIIFRFYDIWIRIAQKDYDGAKARLKAVEVYKNYFKLQQPQAYLDYLFLSAFLEIDSQKRKGGRKYIHTLYDIAANPGKYTVSTKMLGTLYVYLGLLSARLDENEEAYTCFVQAKMFNCYSPLFYVALYQLFMYGSRIDDRDGLCFQLIKWGIANEIDFTALLEKEKSNLIYSFTSEIETAKKIYAAFPLPWIVKSIASYYIALKDYSREAHYYYREAEIKQVVIDQLPLFVVKSAIRNKIETISRYSMNRYLAEETIDVNDKGFVYHVLLTNKKLSGLNKPFIEDMMQYGCYCLENGLTGREYNSIYCFFLENAQAYNIQKKYVEQCRLVLQKDLFVYEAQTERQDIDKVWVFEKDKQNLNIFAVQDGKVRIYVSSEKYTYYCIGKDGRSILEADLAFVKQIENADHRLYQHFFETGYDEQNLVVALSKYYLAQAEPEEGVDILNTALYLRGMSTSYRTKVAATLGNILAKQNRFDKALSYYQGVDENALNSRFIDQMLVALTDGKEYEKAVQLIIKKTDHISDRELFYALKKIAAIKEYQPKIADAAYRLLMKSWFDKDLLQCVVSYYNGSQDDWLALSGMLYDMSYCVTELDTIILENSIWMNKIDGSCQKIFYRMVENEVDHPIIGQYVEYLMYKILLQDFKPVYETISALEKIYLKDNQKLLIYGLSHLYTHHGIHTFHSEDILKEAVRLMENSQIILPSAKSSKDKIFHCPYIMKNQPFIHKTLPDRQVFLYYRSDEEQDYHVLKMAYLKFGVFMAILPQFYSETIHYYFMEVMDTGSVGTKVQKVGNNRINLMENTEDQYFAINNAVIYESMYKFDFAEEILAKLLAEDRCIKGKLL